MGETWGPVERTGKTRKSDEIWVENLKRSLGRPWRRWEENIKIDKINVRYMNFSIWEQL
jgi:hypothetical protein